RPRSRVVLATAADLLVDLHVPGLEHAHEGTGLELAADGVNLGELAALAEHVEERLGAGRGLSERHTFVKDDPPGEEREEEEDDKYPFTDGAGAGEELG